MTKISMASAPQRQNGPGVEMAMGDLGGGWSASVSRIDVDFDMPDLYQGLPGNACPLEHLGYVVKGTFTVTTSDGSDEVYEAGDAFHIMPGHLPHYSAGLEVVDFTDTEASAQVEAHLQSRTAEVMARLGATAGTQ